MQAATHKNGRMIKETLNWFILPAVFHKSRLVQLAERQINGRAIVFGKSMAVSYRDLLACGAKRGLSNPFSRYDAHNARSRKFLRPLRRRVPRSDSYNGRTPVPGRGLR